MPISKPHVILLASPGMGHLIPVVELGKRLVTHHGFEATIFAVAADPSIANSPIFGPSPTPNIVQLPPPDISGLVDTTTSIVSQIAVMMRKVVPSLRAAVSSMKLCPAALVVDMFGTEAMHVADEFNMLKYVFVTTTAWFLAITVHIPTLDERDRYEHGVLMKSLEVPGCKAVRFDDTLDIFVDQTDVKLYNEFARIGVQIPNADGIMLNTWQDLEPSTLSALRDDNLLGRVIKAPIYPVGPLVRPVGFGSKSHILDWLDRQSVGSVIYVSFGSGGTLSAKQTVELAWGLELSQHKFIWVLRPPIDNDSSSAFFDTGSVVDLTPDYLPDGFLTRTHNSSLVVPTWAPQSEILAHGSIGGFLSHCGWNSTLESIVNGVPMISWPLYAEQKLNTAMVTEELMIGIRSKSLENVVGREEIRDMVRNVMGAEGNEMRSRVKDLKVAARDALRKGGSSYNSLSKVAQECQLRVHGLTNKALGACIGEKLLATSISTIGIQLVTVQPIGE